MQRRGGAARVRERGEDRHRLESLLDVGEAEEPPAEELPAESAANGEGTGAAAAATGGDEAEAAPEAASEAAAEEKPAEDATAEEKPAEEGTAGDKPAEEAPASLNLLLFMVVLLLAGESDVLAMKTAVVPSPVPAG